MEESYRKGGVGIRALQATALFEACRDFFAPMRQRREELVADPDFVEDVLIEGAKRARSKAREVIDTGSHSGGGSVGEDWQMIEVTGWKQEQSGIPVLLLLPYFSVRSCPQDEARRGSVSNCPDY